MSSQNDCASALPVTVGVTSVGIINGTLVDGCGGTLQATASNWYVYTPTTSGVVTISSDLSQNDGISNSDDTYLNIYSGTCAALVCIGSNDDTADNYLSSFTFLVESGQSYFIEWVDEWVDDGFDFELTETVATCVASATPPFTDDFTNMANVYVCWETLDIDADGFGWGSVDYDGNPCVVSVSYDNNSFTALTPDNWLISYPIDLTSFVSGDVIELSWLARGIDVDFADENYSVYVANSNDTADLLASSTTFTEIIGQNGGAGVYAARTLDISSLYGQTVYIAFRHHDSSDEFALNIDDVAVNVTPLSTDSFTKNGFSVYPNPALDVLNITSNELTINAISIVDINGRIVKQVSSNQTNAQVNVSDLTSGVYMITIESDNGSTVQKFIKQ